jgi:hypothetical protein
VLKRRYETKKNGYAALKSRDSITLSARLDWEIMKHPATKTCLRDD